jgi:hypothetical protein
MWTDPLLGQVGGDRALGILSFGAPNGTRLSADAVPLKEELEKQGQPALDVWQEQLKSGPPADVQLKRVE